MLTLVVDKVLLARRGHEHTERHIEGNDGWSGRCALIIKTVVITQDEWCLWCQDVEVKKLQDEEQARAREEERFMREQEEKLRKQEAKRQREAELEAKAKVLRALPLERDTHTLRQSVTIDWLGLGA